MLNSVENSPVRVMQHCFRYAVTISLHRFFATSLAKFSVQFYIDNICQFL